MGNGDDDDLVRAARCGDETAFARLQERHRPWVCRLILAVVHDPGHAEDLTQEAFCRVYRHLGDYHLRGQFVPWLRRIALNLARNFLRDRQRETALLARTPPSAESARADPLSDPATVLNSRLLREDVRDALDGLSPEQRQVVSLYYFGGHTLQEIARTTDCSEGTVKSRLFHARRHLRRRLYPAGSATDAP